MRIRNEEKYKDRSRRGGQTYIDAEMKAKACWAVQSLVGMSRSCIPTHIEAICVGLRGKIPLEESRHLNGIDLTRWRSCVCFENLFGSIIL
jgi:hypothetical protein